MNPPLPPDTTPLKALRQQAHPRCVVCSPANPLGLGLEFTLHPDGSVTGEFTASEIFEGYPGLLHGGLAATLLDGSMTNCLFAAGIKAVTAELTVRYRHPVVAQRRMTLGAWRTKAHGPMHQLRAELRQDDQVKVTAIGKFMPYHE